MNPSASGWIKRYVSDDLEVLKANSRLAEEDIYYMLRDIGFIYGTNLNYIHKGQQNSIKLTQEELAKVNLFSGLILVHLKYYPEKTIEEALHSILEYYKYLGRYHKKHFQFHLVKQKPDQQLESVIHSRIKTSDNFIQKNFSNIVTNALLFIDVLSFKHYLIESKDPISYSSSLERLIVNIIYLTLNKKQLKGKYDKMIIKLIQSSLRYYKIDENEFRNLKAIDVDFLSDEIEKHYIIDLTCMIIYEDQTIDQSEKLFIKDFAQQLNFSELKLNNALDFLNRFVLKHKDQIYYFNVSNPLKYFYNNTSRWISVLLRRNKKRIIREITESKELMNLLMISNKRELTEDEKLKVKTQLLDILKTIPSLAIFALPGGSILLPLIIKMIPNLLPSSFNENTLNNLRPKAGANVILFFFSKKIIFKEN
jgi:hypothetical protein